jgi:branched-chain amino acid transport system permease protein
VVCTETGFRLASGDRQHQANPFVPELFVSGGPLTNLSSDLVPLLWSGVISGCLYALGALGLVMIFKSSRVVNFAHGNIAALAAFLVYGLSSGLLMHLSWGSAVALALSAAVVVSALSYVVVMPLIHKSDLASTIATLGIGLVLQGVIQLTFGSEIVSLDLPVPRWGFNIGSLRVNAYDMAVLITTVVIIGGLFIVIERTKLGIAFRAVSSNLFASRVCGINLTAIHLFAWIISAALGIVAALLIVPTTFLSSTTVASFMLQAFAAAVVGGFGSLPGAAVGGILIGIATNLFSFYVSSEFLNTFLLGIVMLALNFFPDGLLEKRSGGRV